MPLNPFFISGSMSQQVVNLDGAQAAIHAAFNEGFELARSSDPRVTTDLAKQRAWLTSYTRRENKLED